MKNFGFWFLNGLGFGCGLLVIELVINLVSLALGY
ncbi:hypothetical protein [Sigmofec virus UA08Rod_5645]|uniref:Uncharacterized protein n=1 Tax=Sigmofec virus UA08Rod_5645 TaxID=2929433 RepID=A0A976N1P5_9VIRU|nr:hypothetical protein [Sigmofec virus UA08Rod_5645]